MILVYSIIFVFNLCQYFFRLFIFRTLFITITFSLFSNTLQAQFTHLPVPSKEQIFNFSGTDLDGNFWSSANLRGKVVVLNFWATWCAPCLAELPTLQTLAQISDPEHISVITVNVRQLKPQIQRFVSATGLELPIILDTKGEITNNFNVRIYPTTILIDTQGLARWKIEGDVDWTSQQANTWINSLNNTKFRR